MINEEQAIRTFEQIESEKEELRHQNRKLVNSNLSLYNEEEADNLIRWQLDLKEDLDYIYHLLKGDTKGEDEEGNIVYIIARDPELRPFNEFGVQVIMNMMAFYLNRNTILSNYSEPTINWKIHDFGVNLSDFIHNRYEDMMTTIEKQKEETEEEFEERLWYHLSNKLKMFPIIVSALVDTTHSAYLRAYNEGERRSLRTARTVTQSLVGQPSNLMGNAPPVMSSKRRLWNPFTWA